MYDFVYYIFYCRNLQKGQAFARYNGSLITALAMYLHLIFVFVCLKSVSKQVAFFNWPFLFENYKFFIVVFAIALVSLIYIYFNKERTANVLLKYGKGQPYKESAKKQWIINLIIGSPLVLGAMILLLTKK